MQEPGIPQEGKPPPREGRGGMWLLAGAALLCPLSKLILLASVGGALGGLLNNKWFLAGALAVIGVGLWLGVRLVRKRLALRGNGAVTCGERPDPADAHAPKEREYTS